MKTPLSVENLIIAMRGGESDPDSLRPKCICAAGQLGVQH